MDRSTLISELQKFQFGSKIICSDGEDGTLAQVGFDPAARRMTHLGIKLGRFFGKTVFIPFAVILEAAGSGITLNITRDELATSNQTSPGGALLDARSQIQNADSSARGTLLMVAVQPKSGELGYVVAHNLRASQDTLLSAEFVAKIDAGQVTVSIPDATLQTLPEYRTDDELQREVEAILFDLAPLHIDLPGMTIRVLDSVLYLDGNISSSLRGDIVEDQASGVQGLVEVKNRLVGDDLLAADLAMALGRDERTRDLPIGVYPRLGVVRLSGAVHTAQQKAAVGEIAGSFAGVRSVFNDLLVDPKEDLLRVMAAPEGGETADIIPGAYVRHTK